MGIQCGCSRYLDPETFIKEVLSSTCLINLTAADLNQILLVRIGSGNDSEKNRSISQEIYTEIAQDIYDKKYFKNKKDFSPLKGNDMFIDITNQFILKLYPLFDINKRNNCALFKLLMCPFVLKASDAFDKKTSQLYRCIRYVNFRVSDKDKIGNDDIEYSIFCENFLTYLAMILSGFTKIIRETLYENNSDELMRNEMDDNLNRIFQAEVVKDYYSYLLKELIAKIVSDDENSNIESYKVTLDDFRFMCKEHEQVLSYFQLREDYIKFAKKKLNSLTLTDN